MAPAQRPAGPPRGGALWGDGFADDGAAEFGRVADWSAVSADEYALLFPRLARSGLFPAPLLAHLEDCIAVRGWRLAAFDGRGGDASARVAALHRDWFADDGAMTCLLRRLGLLRTPRRAIERERASLALLEGVLADLSRGRPPAWSPEREARFAFASGIHPAYLWPEAACSAERGCAAAWLGHLDRGRAALMPAAVAEYLLDAVVGPAGRRDEAVAALAVGVMPPSALRRAAERRQDGAAPVVQAGRRPRSPAPAAAARAATAVAVAAEEASLERA